MVASSSCHRCGVRACVPSRYATRRQDTWPAYVREGTVYAFWTPMLRRFDSIYGDDCRPLLVDAAESLSIDTAADWAAAERVLAGR